MWAIGVIAVFILTFDLPTNWFQVAVLGGGGSEAQSAGAGLMAPILLTLAGGAYLSIIGNEGYFVRLVGLEPLMPLFLGLAVLSTFWSASPQRTLTDSIALSVTAFLGYWIAASFQFRAIMWMLCLALGAGTVVNFVFALAIARYGQSGSGSWTGVLGHENPLGRIGALSVLIFLFGFRLFPRWRSIMLVLCAANGFIMWMSTSKTALVSLVACLVGTFVFQFFRARKVLYGAVALSTGLLSLAVVGMVMFNFSRFTEVLEKDETLSGRSDIWQLSLAKGVERPLFGWGWSGFWNSWFSPSHEVLSFGNYRTPHSHNAFIEYFLALGIVGLVIMLIVFARYFVRAARVINGVEGLASVFPLCYALFSLLFSLSEFGVVSRSSFFLIFIICITLVGAESGRLSPKGPPQLQPEPTLQEALCSMI